MFVLAGQAGADTRHLRFTIFSRDINLVLHTTHIHNHNNNHKLPENISYFLLLI